MTNNLKATKRESKTSGDLNNLRSKGFIPAILYGGNNPSLKISIDEKLLNKVFEVEGNSFHLSYDFLVILAFKSKRGIDLSFILFNIFGQISDSIKIDNEGFQ